MPIDQLGILRRIMNMDVNETFDQSTDSLEAIANALGIGPTVGLWMFGIVDATQVASLVTVIINNLQNIPSDLLEGQFWMQVIHNASAPATAPEGEFRQITNFVQGGALQTFTVDAFTANVEAGDMVCIFHESLLSHQILASGTLTLSDLTQPEDNTRTEGNNYFTGNLLMTTEGAAAFQPRLITSYAGVGGVFDLDLGNPFSILPGLVDYVILKHQEQFIPLVDGAQNRLPADVIGGKADTALYAPIATASLMRYIKGILMSVIGTTAERAMGRLQIAATTIDLNQAAGTYDLFTGTTQVVILENLNIKMPTLVAGGALTSISIQTDDVTAGVIISAADGAVANLTSEADLGWIGPLYITPATKIRLTIAGGATGVAYVCNVTAKLRAAVSEGYLA